MTRRHLTFECEGARLVATLDTAPGRTALLLVSGGNEVRSGAWNGQARLAAGVAAQGYPVLRFDRRGVGDSEGINEGFRSAAPDIAAARQALLSQCPQVDRVIGMGNCDAASALMLAAGAGMDGLVLSNPWTIERESDEAPVQVVRDHYRRRLSDPAAIRRLLTGKVSLPALLRSLAHVLRKDPKADGDSLADLMKRGISGYQGTVRFLVAGKDRTGRAFLSRWDRADPRLHICPDASHSYVEPEAKEWLLRQVLEALRQ